MQCDKCRNEAVLFQPYSGRHLCRRHLALNIEARAKHSIRSHHWMKTGDHIAIVLPGDKKSAALLLFLKKLTAGRRDIHGLNGKLHARGSGSCLSHIGDEHGRPADRGRLGRGNAEIDGIATAAARRLQARC